MQMMRWLICGVVFIGMAYAQAPVPTTRPADDATTRPTTQPTTQPGGKLFVDPMRYYRLICPGAWQVKAERQFVTMRCKDKALRGVQVRLYTIGLRGAGGKYRDARHALDDVKWQITHEMKGKVGAYSSLQWQVGGRTMTGRQFEGRIKRGKDVQRVWVMIIPSTDRNVVVCWQVVAGAKQYPQARQVAEQILHTLEVR